MSLFKKIHKKSITYVDGEFEYATIKYEFHVLDSFHSINIEAFERDIFKFINNEIKNVIKFFWYQMTISPNIVLVIKVGCFNYLKKHKSYDFYAANVESENSRFYECESISEIEDVERLSHEAYQIFQKKILEYYEKTYKVCVFEYQDVDPNDCFSNCYRRAASIEVLLNRNEAMSRGLPNYNSSNSYVDRYGSIEIIRYYYFEDWQLAERMYWRLSQYSWRWNETTASTTAYINFDSINSDDNIIYGEFDGSEFDEDDIDPYHNYDPYDDLLEGNMDAYWNID